MNHYKAPDNSVHCIEPEFAHLLPVGSVEITEEQAAALLPVPESVTPTLVTMRQARLALLMAGHLSAIEDAIDALESPHKEAARIEWEYAQEVRRADPLVQMIAPALGLSEPDLDALFTAAAGL